MTGCAAQTEADTFRRHGPRSTSCSATRKSSRRIITVLLPDFGVNHFEKARVNDIMSVTETAGHMVDALEGRARAFVQVQNGCDHRCTFLHIPFGRGQLPLGPDGRGRRSGEAAGRQWLSEIVLTGVDMTSYGADLPGQSPARPAGGHHPEAGFRIGEIAAFLHRLPSRRILNFSRRSDRRRGLMPHLHLSLQHGDDMILKRMKRRHSRDEFDPLLRRCQADRAPDIVFGADIIAGLPDRNRCDVCAFARRS